MIMIAIRDSDIMIMNDAPNRDRDELASNIASSSISAQYRRHGHLPDYY